MNRIGRVRILSGTAIDRKAMTGVQRMFRIAMATPMLSLASQDSQPEANTRRCCTVSWLWPGSMARQCLWTICMPPEAQR